MTKIDFQHFFLSVGLVQPSYPSAIATLMSEPRWFLYGSDLVVKVNAFFPEKLFTIRKTNNISKYFRAF